MDGGSSEGREARFAAYVEALGAVLGHADRQEPMRDYCLGFYRFEPPLPGVQDSWLAMLALSRQSSASRLQV
jgi:hypothetical protein